MGPAMWDLCYSQTGYPLGVIHAIYLRIHAIYLRICILCTHCMSVYVAKGTLIQGTFVNRLIESGLTSINCVVNQITKCKFSAESGIVDSLKGLVMSEPFLKTTFRWICPGNSFNKNILNNVCMCMYECVCACVRV